MRLVPFPVIGVIEHRKDVGQNVHPSDRKSCDQTLIDSYSSYNDTGGRTGISSIRSADDGVFSGFRRLWELSFLDHKTCQNTILKICDFTD